MSEKRIGFVVVTHYHVEDIDFDSDYYDVEVLTAEDEQRVAEYGDAYHDSGRVKAEAFIEGWCVGRGELPSVVFRNVADRE